MNNKIISILKKVYYHENGFYNRELNRHEHRIPETVSKEDLELLEKSGYKPNNHETFEHDSTLDALITFKQKITLEFATAFFLKGLTGDFKRGRQTLMSYVFIKNLTKHKFKGDGEICGICGLPRKETTDKTDDLYTYYLGHSWNEIPLHFLIELNDIIKYPKPEISDKEIEKLKELLDFIAKAEPNETPGRLEKRISKNRILPKTDKYKRYGILQTLSECGILPNSFIEPKWNEFSTLEEHFEASTNLTTSFRSDIVLPLAGWKGNKGVDYKKAEEIFNLKIKNNDS